MFNFNFKNNNADIENYPQWLFNHFFTYFNSRLVKEMEKDTFQFLVPCNFSVDLKVTLKADLNKTPICQIHVKDKLIVFFDFSLVDNPFAVISAVSDIYRTMWKPIAHNKIKTKARRLGTYESNLEKKPYYHLCFNKPQIIAISQGKEGHWFLDGRQIANGLKDGRKTYFNSVSYSEAEIISQRLGLNLEGDFLGLVSTDKANFDLCLALRTPKMVEFERHSPPKNFVMVSAVNSKFPNSCLIPVLQSRLADFRTKQTEIHRRWYERSMAEEQDLERIEEAKRLNIKKLFGL